MTKVTAIRRAMRRRERRINRNFAFLSKDIIENRRRIIENAAAVRRVELRVWDLEDHTPEETLQKVKEWGKQAEKLIERIKPQEETK